MNDKCKRCGIAGGSHAHCANDLWARLEELKRMVLVSQDNAVASKRRECAMRDKYSKHMNGKTRVENVRLRAQLAAKDVHVEAWRDVHTAIADTYDRFIVIGRPSFEERRAVYLAALAKARALDAEATSSRIKA